MVNYKLNALMMSALAGGAKVRNMIKGMELSPYEQNLSEEPIIAALSPSFLSPKKVKEFVQNTAYIAQQGAEKGASLLVFPEYYGDQIIFCGLFSERLLEEFLEQAEHHFPNDRYLSKLVRSSEGYTREIYFNTFSCLAKQLGVYIASGSLMTVEEGNLKNRSYLFAPDGQVILQQDKLFLSKREEDAGFSSGEEIQVVQTQLGGMMISSVEALSVFEPFYIGKQKGADLVIVNGIHNKDQELHARFRAQAHRQFLISARYSGSSVDIFPFVGGNTIIAPRLLSEKRNGIIVSEDQSLVTAVSYPQKLLSDQFNQYDGDNNPQVLEQIERLYEAGRLPQL